MKEKKEKKLIWIEEEEYEEMMNCLWRCLALMKELEKKEICIDEEFKDQIIKAILPF